MRYIHDLDHLLETGMLSLLRCSGEGQIVFTLIEYAVES